jgi:hypothetical protein
MFQSAKDRDKFGDLGLDRGTIIKGILRKQDLRMWAGFFSWCGPVACCPKTKGPSSSINVGKSLEHPND